MTNTIFKRLLLPALLLALVTSFFAPKSAEAVITGNNSPNTASSMGYWKNSRSDTTILLKVKMKRIISLRSIKVKEFMSEVRIISNIRV